MLCWDFQCILAHHGEKTCTSWYFFQKSWTQSCSWNRPFIFKWTPSFPSTIFHAPFLAPFPLKSSLGRDRNVIKLFSPLNLTIICINPFFTSNNTTFSVSFLNEISFLHKTSFFKYAITDSIKNLIFPLSNAPSLKSLWWVILIFMLFVLLTGNKVLANLLVF